MSYVIAAPEFVTAAATDLAGIGSTLSAARMTAASSTTTVIPAAADEVSASISDLFSQYGAEFQALAGKASVFHDQFVQNLKGAAGAYTSAEAAIASFLQGMTPGAGFLSTLALSLPPQLQQLLATLEGLGLLGFIVVGVLLADLLLELEVLLGKFGL